MQVLVIDGANVVGSRPDGWWRDRAGAARRLLDQVSDADLPQDEIVLVLEGAARAGPKTGRGGRINTVHAVGSGDDAVVDVVTWHAARGGEVVVVTADRALRGRVEAAGATCVGPSWLIDRL